MYMYRFHLHCASISLKIDIMFHLPHFENTLVRIISLPYRTSSICWHALLLLTYYTTQAFGFWVSQFDASIYVSIHCQYIQYDTILRLLINSLVNSVAFSLVTFLTYSLTLLFNKGTNLANLHD